MQMRVYYEDTDAGGIVYHSNYLKFCERARSEIFFERGLSPASEETQFVVAHVDASFKAPAKLGDLLNVTTELKSTKRSSLILKQEVFCEEKPLFSMDVTLVFMKNSKPSRLSEETLELFRRYKS